MRLCVQGIAFFLFTCFDVASMGFIGREVDSLGELLLRVAFERGQKLRSKRIMSYCRPVIIPMTSGSVWAHSFVMKAEHPAVVMASLVTVSSCEENPTT